MTPDPDARIARITRPRFGFDPDSQAGSILASYLDDVRYEMYGGVLEYPVDPEDN